MTLISSTPLINVQKLIEDRKYDDARQLLSEISNSEFVDLQLLNYFKEIVQARVLLDQGKYDGSLEHAIEAYKMGIKKKNAKLILDSINLQGLIHWRIGDPNKLENVVREGMILVSNLTEAEEAEIGGSEGDLYNLDGLLAWNRGNFDIAIKCHNSALAIRQKLNDDYAIAVSLNNLGIVYLAQGNLVDALENITKSVSLWQKKQNKRVMAYSYKNLGIIYSGLKDYQAAEINMEQALSIWREFGDEVDMSDILFELIRLSALSKNKDQANAYYSQLKGINDQSGNKIIALRTRIAEALVLLNKGRLESMAAAFKIFKEVLIEETIDIRLRIIAIQSSCELLIKELMVFENLEVMKETESLILYYYELAQKQQSTSMIVESLVLRAKFQFIRGRFDQSNKLLNQAEITASEGNLLFLVEKVETEKELLRLQVEKYLQSTSNIDSLKERIHDSQIFDYLGGIKDFIKGFEKNLTG